MVTPVTSPSSTSLYARAHERSCGNACHLRHRSHRSPSHFVALCGDHVVMSAPTIARTTDPMGIALPARRAGPALRRCGG